MSFTSDVHKMHVAHGPHCGNSCHIIYQRLEQVLDMISFKSEKCLMPGEHITRIWYSCLEIVNTVHPMIFLSFPSCAWVVLVRIVFQTSPQKIVMCQIGQMNRTRRMTNYSGPYKLCKGGHWIIVCFGSLQHLAGRTHIFKLTIENKSLHQDSNDNGVRIVNFTTSKNLVVKSTMFPHRDFHKYTWTSPDGKTHNQINHILIDRRRQSSILDVRSVRGADCDTDHYLVVAKVRERLIVSKQAAQKFDGIRINLRKLKKLEVRKRYQIKFTNRFANLGITRI